MHLQKILEHEIMLLPLNKTNIYVQFRPCMGMIGIFSVNKKWKDTFSDTRKWVVTKRPKAYGMKNKQNFTGRKPSGGKNNGRKIGSGGNWHYSKQAVKKRDEVALRHKQGRN